VAGVGAALALLSVIAVIAYRSIAAFVESAGTVAHSYTIIAELGQLESEHSRMRLAWRTYLTSPAEDALDDYRTSRQALRDSAAHLELLTRDNAQQHARTVALSDVIGQDILSTDASLSAKLAGSIDGSVSILETISSLRGNGDRIGALSDETEDAERTLLARREARNTLQGAHAKVWLVVGSLAGLAILSITFLALQREMLRRLHVQQRAEAYAVEVEGLNTQLKAYSDRVEATNRELEGFSYSVSHDLRAPLRAINGFASMLEDDYGERLDAEGRRLLGVVRSNADAMARLIDDLLAFSRLGKASFVAAPVDMSALVAEVMTERGEARDSISVGPMPVAYGDRGLLKQVWANLIDNAVKYTGHVANPEIAISGDAGAAGEIEYRINDNGAGFDMRYYDKLFGVFQRLHSPSEFPGTGVGLAIVNRIITRHGGRVWGEGRPGAGATFHFTLPSGGAHA
jgi:signal transduction histidine kinase